MDAWYYRLPRAARVAITAVVTVCVLIPMYLWLAGDVLAPLYSVGMAFAVGLVIGLSVIVGEKQIHGRFGSIEEYFATGLGIDHAEQETLRRRLLVEAA